MFADGDQKAKETWNPVAADRYSATALRKVALTTRDDGTPVHSFPTLLADLATVMANTCCLSLTGETASTFPVLAIPDP